MKKIKIALTGGIGVGKSAVASLFQQHGAEVVSGDELGRQVLVEDLTVRAAIISRYGAEVLDSDSSLNRKAIAERVFADPQQSQWLTTLTFPGIYSRWRSAFEASSNRVVVFDASLIFEWNIQQDFDLIVVVAADAGIALERAGKKFTSADFERRARSQLSVEHKIANADCVIWNNNSPDALAQEVEQFWNSNIQPLIA